jgi:hypothetical protein
MAKLCPQQTSSTAWPSELRSLSGPFVTLSSLLQQNQGNHIQIKWIATEWFGRGATRRVVKTSIPKTLEYGYTPAALKKYARDWEWPLVEATERELASLRKQAAYLVKAKMAIRQANKALLQSDGEDESEEG